MQRKINRPTDSEFDTDSGKRIWWYLSDQTFMVGGKAFVVPANYCFDGATVPRALWSLFSPVGVAFHPAALHDFLYDTQGKGIAGEYNLTRKEVDKVFLVHLLGEGAPKAQAWLMWLGVRTPIGLNFWKNESYPRYLLPAKQ